jgi:acid phosphatase type 7
VRTGVLVVLSWLAVASAAADAPPAPPPSRGVTLLPASAAWRWQLVTTPRLATQLGAHAVSAVDVAAGARSAPIPVLGDPVPGPTRWPFELDVAQPAIGAAPPDQRIAAAFGIAQFTLGSDADGLQMLELRLRYHDGVAVWLNGIEIVRRNLPRGSTTALARRPRGPEWETFYLPVAPGLLRYGPNTLAVEVHPSSRRDAPELAADLVGRRDRGVVRGPILVETGRSTATIVVETDPNVDAVLEWGAGDASDRRQTSPPGRLHRFTLAGLAPGTRHGYRVIAGATRSERFAFVTQPDPRATIRVGIYGDVRGGHAIHRGLVERMLAEGLDAIVVTGDLVARGSDPADWQRFFALTHELLAQVPFYPAIGNHDLGWDGPGGVDHLFAIPSVPDRPPGTYWYSREVADVHLVFLDSNAYDQREQEVWLEADLAAARRRGVRAIVAITHDGPYARGYHGGNAIARDRYVPILTRHRVDFVFAGHDHIYQRGQVGGLRYVVTGGGGAPLYGIRCGVPGRPRCRTDDGMQVIAREHHYAVLTIGRQLELCVRRADGGLLERCSRFPLVK